MKIDTYLFSDCGARANNEDYGERYCGADGTGVFVVCDGLGGHNGGEIASRGATRFVQKSLQSCKHFSESLLLNTMNNANRAVLLAQKKAPERADMRTTIVCATVAQNTFRYFHVGDSRLYYFKNGTLYTQTVDHSLPQATVAMGELSPSLLRFSEDRNKLLKVLGNKENLSIAALAPPVTIESGDAFLLCTDGFWEYVYEVEMEQDLVKSGNAEQWCSFMLRRLLRRVSNNNDNFTALCGRIS